MRLALACGCSPTELSHRWSVQEFNEAYEMHLNGLLDVDGWQKAGATIAWLLNPHRAADSKPLTSADWHVFRTRPPEKAEEFDPQKFREAMAKRFGT